jgi:hypothetical protein
MSGKKKVAAAGLVVLILLATQACSDLSESALTGQSYIRLSVGPPTASRAVSVTEYDVTGLRLVVLGPGGAELAEIDWTPADGQASYLVPVVEPGEHELSVTHIGMGDTEEVSVTELATFNIQAMIITTINVVPGLVGQIRIDTGEPPQPQEDGTVTVAFTEADVTEGHDVLIGVYPAGSDPMSDPFGLLVAHGGIELVSGAGSTTLTEMGDGPQPVWYGAGGASYDVYIWVDMNENLETGVWWQEPGIDLQLSTFPVTVTISGDVYLSYTGGDLVVTPEP